MCLLLIVVVKNEHSLFSLTLAATPAGELWADHSGCAQSPAVPGLTGERTGLPTGELPQLTEIHTHTHTHAHMHAHTCSLTHSLSLTQTYKSLHHAIFGSDHIYILSVMGRERVERVLGFSDLCMNKEMCVCWRWVAVCCHRATVSDTHTPIVCTRCPDIAFHWYALLCSIYSGTLANFLLSMPYASKNVYVCIYLSGLCQISVSPTSGADICPQPHLLSLDLHSVVDTNSPCDQKGKTSHADFFEYSGRCLGNLQKPFSA